MSRSATASNFKAGPESAPLPAAAPTLTFEVQFFRDKRWRIDSIFDDCSLAVFVAKQMNDSGRYLCVRVVQEHFDPITRHTKLTTLYRGGRIEQAHKKEIEDGIKARNDRRERAEGSAAKSDPRDGVQERRLWLALAAVSAVALLFAGWVAVLMLK